MKKRFDLMSEKDWPPFLDYLLNLRGKARITVVIDKYRKKRSLNANSFYWGVCIPTLAEHFGYRPQEMHMAILGAYTGWETRTFQGHAFIVPRRTSTTPDTMDTTDFSGLIQTAQQIAAEEGIILGDMDDNQAA